MYLNKVKHFFVLAIAVFMVACSSGSAPDKVAENYVSAMINADIDAFIATIYLTDKEQQEFEMVKGKMSEMLNAASAAAQLQGGVKSVKAVSTEYSSNKKEAVVEVELTFNNGNSDSEDVNMIKTDEGWKVQP